jgi:hypothetical protein
MLETLPKPEVLRQGVDREQNPSVPAQWLRWNHDAPTTAEKIWYLPQDVCLTGPAPERFGVTIQRRGVDSYSLRLVWNDMSLSWHGLRRVQILSSALNPLLNALGQNLWHMLEQPVRGEKSHPSLAA